MSTPGPWRVGKVGDAIVADAPVEHGPDGCDDVEYYGGHLIAESVAPSNRSLIIAAPRLLKALKALAHVAVWDDDSDRAAFDAAFMEAGEAIGEAERIA